MGMFVSQNKKIRRTENRAGFSLGNSTHWVAEKTGLFLKSNKLESMAMSAYHIFLARRMSRVRLLGGTKKKLRMAGYYGAHSAS